MQEFFDFIMWFCQQFTIFLLYLPFMESGDYGSFTFGYALLCVAIMCLFIVVLVGSVKNWSLRHEARM